MSRKSKYRKAVRNSILDSTSEEYLRVKAGEVPSDDDRAAKKRDSKKKKKLRFGSPLYFLVVVLISVLLAAFIIPKAIIYTNQQLCFEIPVSGIDFSSAPDGGYSGEYTTNQISAVVNVSIIDHRITDVSLISYQGIDPSRGKVICRRIFEQQSVILSGDDSGTEYTDRVVQYAAMDALKNAVISGTPVSGSDSGAAEYPAAGTITEQA